MDIKAQSDGHGRSTHTEPVGLDSTASQLPALLKWALCKVALMAIRHSLVPETNMFIPCGFHILINHASFP